MPSVSMPLYEVAGSGPCPCPDHRALLAAYQRAADASDYAPDNRPSPSAVMVSASLREAFADEGSEQ
jgi:hypothetical protein